MTLAGELRTVKERTKQIELRPATVEMEGCPSLRLLPLVQPVFPLLIVEAPQVVVVEREEGLGIETGPHSQYLNAAKVTILP